MAEDDAALEKNLGQIAQGQPIAQPPQHHEGDDVRGVLDVVQQAAAALVELLAALAAAEPAIAPSRAFWPLRHGGGAAGHTVHPDSRPAGSGVYQRHPGQPNRPLGASPDRSIGIEWFEVGEIRGRVRSGEAAQYQVSLGSASASRGTVLIARLLTALRYPQRRPPQVMAHACRSDEYERWMARAAAGGGLMVVRDFDTSQYYSSLALVITRPTMPYAIASSVPIQ
jgi:hypothetical protein